MAEVKKRDKIPEVFEPPKAPPDTLENIVIIIGDKKYPLPIVPLREYKKILKEEKELMKKGDLSEEDNIEFAQRFFYRILKKDNPDLKMSDMDDMPTWQAGGEFFIKVRISLFRVPLG
jgi:hypothetical protein